jgi:hypothetical protein
VLSALPQNLPLAEAFPTDWARGGAVTFESHLSELARGRELAIAHGQLVASVQAEHYRGKAAGLYENQMRVTVEPSDEELLKEVERLLGKETAEAIGAALREQ